MATFHSDAVLTQDEVAAVLAAISVLQEGDDARVTERPPQSAWARAGRLEAMRPVRLEDRRPVKWDNE